MTLQSLSSDFSGDYDAIVKKAIAEILRDLPSKRPGDVEGFVRSVMQKHGIDDKARRAILEYVVKGAAFGTGVKKLHSPAAFQQVYLNRVYDPEGVTLSSRLHDLRRHGELIGALRDAMKAKESWGMAAQAVFKKGVQLGDPATDIVDLMKRARRLYGLSEDGQGYSEFRRGVEAVQRRINRLENPDTSKLKRAYQSVIDLTEKSSKAAVERAAKYMWYFKEKYNSERLTTTEIARAYGQARIVEMQSNEDVVACRSVLNSAHGPEDRDICDFYAEADLYGMGAGVFPKNHLPPYPYHPWCICKLEDVFVGEVKPADASDFDPKRGEKFLKSLSAEERKALLGKAGSEAFAEDPKGWREYLKSYNDPERVAAKISKEVLYGRS